MSVLSFLERIRFTRYNLREVYALLGNRTGRTEAGFALLYYLLPLTSRLARWYRRVALRRTRIVMVVGSLGKTSAAAAIRAALGVRSGRTAMWNGAATAPFCLFAIPPSRKTAVIEVGINGPGQMAPIQQIIQPDWVVVTSIASEHITAFKTLEATRAEKAEAVRRLAPAGIAFLNGDDPHVRWMAGETRARVVTYGFGGNNDVRAGDAHVQWPRGTCFRLQMGEVEREAATGLLGRHMVYAALAAVAVGREAGLELDAILARLAELKPVGGRLDVRPLANGAWLVADEFKSARESIDAAFDVLDEIPAAGRKVVVLGPVAEPMGSQSAHYRALGERIARAAQLAVFVDCYREYKAGIHRAGMPQSSVVDASRGLIETIEYLRREIRPGDVILVKGRQNQRLERITLALEGRTVRCAMRTCRVRMTRCAECSRLETG